MFNIGNLLNMSKLISPMKGLEMLKSGLEQNLGQPVNHFEVIFINTADNEDVYVKVWLPDRTIMDVYKGPMKSMLIFTIKNLAKTQLKENEVLDWIRGEYKPNETLDLMIGLTRNGEKVCEVIENYNPKNPVAGEANL